MSGPYRRDSFSVPSIPTGSSGRGSHSQGESFSGDNSVQSRIDSSDRWRFGGPGLLPAWPLKQEGPSPEISFERASAVTDTAVRLLNQKDLVPRMVGIFKRYSEGKTPRLEDNTVLIRADLSARHSEWLSFLDDLISALINLGWPGRVEILDERITGMKTFAPRVSEHVRQQWPDIRGNVIRRLSNHNIPWVMVVLVNRGYWDQVSVPTVIANIDAPLTTPAWTGLVEAVSGEICNDLNDYSLNLIATGTDGLWGLFSAYSPIRKPFSGSLPFTSGYNSMGISVSREGMKPGDGTIGGYLLYHDAQSNTDRCIAITCYHVIRGQPGQIDENLQARGGRYVGYPCQSPSVIDFEMARKEISDTFSESLDNLPDWMRQIQQNEQREAYQKLATLDAYNIHIGTVSAASGWRNVTLEPSALFPPDILMDWASIKVSQRAHWQHTANFIGDFSHHLGGNGNPAASYWTCQNQLVERAVTLPPRDTIIFKKGRSTGVTAGKLGSLVGPEFRLPDVPESLHHHAYVITSDFGLFADHGDSGAWCLNGQGELVGLLIGGDVVQGTGLMIPIEVVARDIERTLGLAPNTLNFPGWI